MGKTILGLTLVFALNGLSVAQETPFAVTMEVRSDNFMKDSFPVPGVTARMTFDASNLLMERAAHVVQLTTDSDGRVAFRAQANLGKRWTPATIGQHILAIPFLQRRATLQYAIELPFGGKRRLYVLRTDILSEGATSTQTVRVLEREEGTSGFRPPINQHDPYGGYEFSANVSEGSGEGTGGPQARVSILAQQRF